MERNEKVAPNSVAKAAMKSAALGMERMDREQHRRRGGDREGDALVNRGRPVASVRAAPSADDQRHDHRHQPGVACVHGQMRGVEPRRVQAEQSQLEREQDRRHRAPEPDRREAEPGRRDLVSQRFEQALAREVGEDEEVLAGEAGVEPGQVERRAASAASAAVIERRAAPAEVSEMGIHYGRLDHWSSALAAPSSAPKRCERRAW